MIFTYMSEYDEAVHAAPSEHDITDGTFYCGIHEGRYCPPYAYADYAYVMHRLTVQNGAEGV